MAKHQARLDEAAAKVLVVGFEPAAKIEQVRERTEVPFTFLVDEQRAAYRAFGLGEAGALRVYAHPSVLLKGAAAHLQGGLWRPKPGQDRRQLGGDFVVDPGGVIAYAYPQRGPEDRSPVGPLIVAAAG